MIIIVDGYNLLKSLGESSIVSATQRSAFINLLGKYSERRGHKIKVVFDGGQEVINPITLKQHGVTVIYSGIYKTADELIIELTFSYQARELVLVTADRGIITQIAAKNTHVIDPKTFYNKVKDLFKATYTVKDQGLLIKLSKENNHELDELMFEAAFFKMSPKYDLEFDNSLRKTKGNVASKEERTYHRTLKKL